MGWPFPDNDDHAGDWDDPEPEESCRHGVPVSQSCDDCAEAAYERFLDRFYGGDQPVTLQEQYEAAAEEKRRLG